MERRHHREFLFSQGKSSCPFCVPAKKTIGHDPRFRENENLNETTQNACLVSFKAIRSHSLFHGDFVVG
jgi:thioredoxin-related protein